MSTQYQEQLAELRAAYATVAQTELDLFKAQNARAQADARVIITAQALTKYVESLEVQIEDPPS